MLKLNALQVDALCEILNIGVGKSAEAMSRLVGEEVLLSVPELTFMTVGQAAMQLSRDGTRMYSVRQPFKGLFSGDAMLIFPEDRSLELVRSMANSAGVVEDLAGYTNDAMTEVGNVILNACLASLSDIFGHPFDCAPASLEIGSGRHILGARAQNHAVMFIRIRFVLNASNSEGFVVFVMNTTSLEDFRLAINRFLGDALPASV